MNMAFDKYTASVAIARNKKSALYRLLRQASRSLMLILLIQNTGLAQTAQKYLVLLRDKVNSPYSISQPNQFLSQRSILRRQKQNIAVQERDLPVNPAYVTQLQQAGAKIWFSSRWLNAVLVEATATTISTIQTLPFVKGLEFNRSLANVRVSAETRNHSNKVRDHVDSVADDQPLDYGNSVYQLTQLGVDKMHQQGYHGEGMLIGVLDAGFRNADKLAFLKPVFDEKRVLATYDFVKKETSVYEDDYHGLSCLSAIAATADKQLYGTAYKASFILLRTEDADSEKQIEEANWLFGAEYADSVGVDVISSSLGYSVFRDTPWADYTYQNMDGKTALSTRAAQIATETGMVVVVAAGNEGSSGWHYITAPSDAASVLAIGAVTQSGVHASFSSFGPSADGRVKPDLDARGQGTVVGNQNGQITQGDGTSFAAPLIAGLVAGFWQAHPRMTAAQVTDALRRSGSQYGNPDDLMGYGIPNFERASTISNAYDQLFVFPNPFSDTQDLGVQWGEIEVNVPLDATLTDVTGRIVWQNRYTSPGLAAFVLPRLGLSTGIYFMSLVAGDKKRTLKVVKQ